MPQQSELKPLMVRVDPKVFDLIAITRARARMSARAIVENGAKLYCEFLLAQIDKRESEADG